MSSHWKRVAAIGGGVLVLAVGTFFLLGNKPGDLPLVGSLVDDPNCPLTGLPPKNEAHLDRPAVAIKIENNRVAYPLSGLEDADIVYEEVVEGGITRFMSVYHCGSTDKAGPVRSARTVDPAIMSPITRILGAAGGNPTVRGVLEESEIVIIDEPGAGDAMSRIDRPGIASEHTLYADVEAVRKIGKKSFSDPPSDDLFSFGKLEGDTKPAKTVTITFSPSNVARFEWKDDRYYRSQGDEPLIAENGDQLATDNVLVEQHTINPSDIGDVAGNKSPEITDVTGTGRAILFRDGRAIVGRWVRETEEDPVRFETRSGDEMVLHAGTTWIELAPNSKGKVKGSVSFKR